MGPEKEGIETDYRRRGLLIGIGKNGFLLNDVNIGTGRESEWMERKDVIDGRRGMSDEQGSREDYLI